MRRTRLVLAGLLAVLLSACQDPYQRTDPLGSETTPAAGDPPAAAPSQRQPAPAVRGQAQRTPRSAVEAFCAEWANWDWRTLERQQRRLAELATGELARQLADEASLRAGDRSLRRDRLGSQGTVVAIDVKPGAPKRRAVCVARETPISGARADTLSTRHRVFLATVTRAGRGWAISAWAPQP